MVRLKYHNPAVSMTVDRTVSTDDRATMSVFFAPDDAPTTSGSPTASATPPSSTSGDKEPAKYSPASRVEEIDMTGRSSSDIFDTLLRMTKASVVQPTAADEEELRELKDRREKSARDAKLSLEVRRRKKREADLLSQAKGELA